MNWNLNGGLRWTAWSDGMATRAVLGVLSLALVLGGCPLATRSPDPPLAEIPRADSIEDGSYLTSVLSDQTSDTLTHEGSEALNAALQDADLKTLAATDWATPIDQLVTDMEAANRLLRSLAPVYDKPCRDPGERNAPDRGEHIT